jgi:predicted Zn-dependent peptidase
MLVTAGEIRSVEDQLARWDTVTHDDVRRVIATVYAATPPLTVALGPDYRR